MEQSTKKLDSILSQMTCLFFFLNGLVCVVFAEGIQKILPYVTGTFTILAGMALLIKSIHMKEYKTLDTNKTPKAVIMLILGMGCFIKVDNAIALIGTIWGVYGLVKGVNGLNIAIYNMTQKKKFKLESIHAIIETALSVMLVFNPFEKITEHIFLLGVEMILEASRRLFKDKNYREE